VIIPEKGDPDAAFVEDDKKEEEGEANLETDENLKEFLSGDQIDLNKE